MKTLVELDPWLKPYANHLAGRQAYVTHKKSQILGDKSLDEFALGHLYFGLHKTSEGWVLREWAPNATQIFLIGDFNNWQDLASYQLIPGDNGVWEILLGDDSLGSGAHFKLHVFWDGGDAHRIPSYANYVVQDEKTKDFSAVVWQPEPFAWSDNSFVPSGEIPLIYEAHVGMSSEKPEVSTYKKFTREVLPRIKKSGYNTVQLMAIQEHPYYGSFGYHVSNFFAASSRFGTPDDLKELVDTAHSLGLRVIIDLVHSHAVKNEAEGLSRFDGTPTQYFHAGKRGEHPTWDSRVFDYGKPEVMHFLLSNCRWWLDEYHVDGFRFDGITSIIYLDHGLKKPFTSYEDYFGNNIDQDALTYLTMANYLIHDIKPSAITIAEDTSGYPGLASQPGVGFDYRLSMGVPDLWIKTLKEIKDEDWDLGFLVRELTAKRPEEKVISYAESHDQALVGDQTLMFRLVGKNIYDHMQIGDNKLSVERGIALHKMIRLITAGFNGGGYLNFMGNEFGHPEWIDFPREGNDWSYHYARRQWSLADDPKLKYHWLGAFDKAMLDIVRALDEPASFIQVNNDAHAISFIRNGYLFAFNFSPATSLTDYDLPAPNGRYEMVLTTDESRFGGQNRINQAIPYPCSEGKITLYLPARTAVVLKLI